MGSYLQSVILYLTFFVKLNVGDIIHEDIIFEVLKYDIEIKPYFNETGIPVEKEFSFDGITRIILKTERDGIDKIYIHANDLNLTQTELNAITNSNDIEKYIPINITDVSISKNSDDILVISLEEPMQKMETYELSFQYSAKLRNNERGFYTARYKDGNNETEWMAVTHLSRGSARKVFPCFDDLKYKSTYVVRIDHDKKYKSWSNMNLNYSTPINGTERVLDVYKMTPLMSTYLVAFAVANFDERLSPDGNISVISRYDVINDTMTALELAPRIIQAFDDFTQLPYSSMNEVEKLDLIALPTALSSAMENWGLVTFMEQIILYNPDKDPIRKKQSMVGTLTHEIAHMWFGNLVTCDDYRFLWLNEGFGRYFHYFATNEVLADYDMDKQFLVEQLFPLMRYDIFYDLPLTATSGMPPSMIITYSKGATIIRSIQLIMGYENFKAAIQNYLRDNQYKTVTPDIFFNALNMEWQYKDIDFIEVLKDFTVQPGYPVITLTLSENGKSFNVTQEPFSYDDNKINKSIQWTIPLTYTTNVETNFSKTEPRAFLRKNTTEIISLDHEADWIIANIQLSGYYRVNYDIKTWYKIRNALKSENFSGICDITRSQLLNDIINLAEARLLSFRHVLEIFEYLVQETHYLSWHVAEQFLTNLMNEVLDPQYKQLLNEYIMKLTQNIYRILLFSNQTQEEKILDGYTRPIILNLACNAGLIDCISKSKEYFDDLIQNNNTIPNGYQYFIYCNVIRIYGVKYFDFLFDDLQSDRLKISALACSSEKDLIIKLLNYGLNIEDNEIISIVLGYGNNWDITLNFIHKNFNRILATFSPNFYKLEYIFEDLIKTAMTGVQLKKAESFIDYHRVLFNRDTQSHLKSMVNERKETLKKIMWRRDGTIEYLKLKEELQMDAISSGQSLVKVLLDIFIAILYK